jgi:hypothetical protein
MTYNVDDPSTWPGCKPYIIAHDVARSRDRSTAVVGGNSAYGRRLLGIQELIELPQGLAGTALAAELMAIDRRYHSNSLIVADISNDPTYAEVLLQAFGRRVLGLQISRHGDGMGFAWRPAGRGAMLVYTIGRTALFDLLENAMNADQVRMVDGPMARKAFQQLNELEVELRETDRIYKCLPGKHDDLGISCAMLAWAARHPHLGQWVGQALAPRKQWGPPVNAQQAWRAFT